MTMHINHEIIISVIISDIILLVLENKEHFQPMPEDEERKRSLFGVLNLRLMRMLENEYGIELNRVELKELMGFFIRSMRVNVKHALTINQNLSGADLTYILVHTVAHVLLGHAERPFATILEPFRTRNGEYTVRGGKLSEWESLQHQQADILTRTTFTAEDEADWEQMERDLLTSNDSVKITFHRERAKEINHLVRDDTYYALRPFYKTTN